MERYNCLIVDDEPIARTIIEEYCTHFPSMNICGSCGNAFEAKKMMEEHTIHILFLDINMPVLDGMAFLKTLKQSPQVIFTTAYKEYGADAFDLDACDYLLKPFSLDRFIVAVDKALERIRSKPSRVVDDNISSSEKFIFIKTSGKIYKIWYDDLLFAEASGNYTRIITTGLTLVPMMTLTALEAQLPSSSFIRVHRSYIINKSKISHVEGNRVSIGGLEIAIGENFKERFFKELGFNL